MEPEPVPFFSDDSNGGQGPTEFDAFGQQLPSTEAKSSASSGNEGLTSPHKSAAVDLQPAADLFGASNEADFFSSLSGSAAPAADDIFSRVQQPSVSQEASAQPAQMDAQQHATADFQYAPAAQVGYDYTINQDQHQQHAYTEYPSYQSVSQTTYAYGTASAYQSQNYDGYNVNENGAYQPDASAAYGQANGYGQGDYNVHQVSTASNEYYPSFEGSYASSQDSRLGVEPVASNAASYGSIDASQADWSSQKSGSTSAFNGYYGSSHQYASSVDGNQAIVPPTSAYYDNNSTANSSSGAPSTGGHNANVGGFDGSQVTAPPTTGYYQQTSDTGSSNAALSTSGNYQQEQFFPQHEIANEPVNTFDEQRPLENAVQGTPSGVSATSLSQGFGSKMQSHASVGGDEFIDELDQLVLGSENISKSTIQEGVVVKSAGSAYTPGVDANGKHIGVVSEASPKDPTIPSSQPSNSIKSPVSDTLSRSSQRSGRYSDRNSTQSQPLGFAPPQPSWMSNQDAFSEGGMSTGRSHDRFSWNESKNQRHSMPPAFEDDAHSVTSLRSYMTDVKKCPQCRKNNEGDANFCSKCGSSLAGSIVETSRPASAFEPQMYPRPTVASPAPSAGSHKSISHVVSTYTGTPYDGGSYYQTKNSTEMYNHADPLPPSDIHDPLERRKGCPLISFGFGGKFVTMFTSKQTRFHNNAMVEHTFHGAVTVHSLKKFAEKRSLRLFEDLKSYKGPFERMKKKDVLKWITTALEDQFHGSKRQYVLKLLKLLAETEGKLFSNTNFAELLLKSVLEDQGLSPLAESVQVYEHAPVTEAYCVVRQLLLEGKREDAIQKAKESNMWMMALVIATHVNKDVFNSVIQDYAHSSFQPEDPLFTVLSLFGGGSAFAPLFTGVDLQSTWKKHVRMILSNRTMSDSTALGRLGDALRSMGLHDEASFCFLVSGYGLDGLKSAGEVSKMVLVGADHTMNYKTFFNDIFAFQATECFEYLSKLGNSGYALPHLQAYKLVYAHKLVEFGYNEEAIKYCEAAINSLKQFNQKSQYFTAPFLEGLSSLNERLSSSGVQSTSNDSGWFSKAKILESIDRGLTSMIAGDVVPSSGTPPPVQVTKTPPPPQKNSLSMTSTQPQTYDSGFQPIQNHSTEGDNQQSGYEVAQNSYSMTGNSYYGTGAYDTNTAYNQAPATDSVQPSAKQYDTFNNGYGTGYGDYQGYYTNSYNQQPQSYDPNTYETKTASSSAQQQASTSSFEPQYATSEPNTTSYDDDLGFGNTSLQSKKPSPPEADRKQRASSEQPPEERNKTDDGQGHRREISRSSYLQISSLFQGISGIFRRESAPPEPKAKVANLGETNSFYYDEKLGKWVNGSSKGEDDSRPETPVAPPTGVPMSRPPTAPPTTPNVLSTLSSRANSPAPGSADMINSQAPVSNASKRGTIRRSARSRYVDTFNPEANQKTDERPNLSQAFIPLATASALPKIMSPGPYSKQDGYDQQ